VACLASGIAAGLLTAGSCQRSGADCHIAAIQVLSSDPTPWIIWLNWINWLPGVIFGVLFALTALDPGKPDRVRRVAVYALASGLAYLMAGLAFALLLSPASGKEFDLILWVWPAGLAAGLVGAFVLALVSNKLFQPPDSAAGALAGTWLPAIVGAVLGALFVWICIYGEQQILIAWPIAFSLWQIGVGLALMRLTPTRHASTD
jgi:hypothetical protein